MGNCSSPLRRHIRNYDAEGVQREVEAAGEGSPDLINEDFSADCILDSCQRNQNTVLHTAMSYGQLDILDILLKYGGDPDTRSRYHGQMILHQAARQNNLAAVRMIVKYDADVHALDDEGRMPLHSSAGSLTARMNQNVTVLQYLLEDVGKSRDINVQDSSGNTPLHAAVIAEHSAAAKYLIEKGADMDITNNRGNKPGDLINQAKDSFRYEMNEHWYHKVQWLKMY